MGLALSLACFLQRFLVREQCVLVVDIHAVLHHVQQKGCVISNSILFAGSGNGRRVHFSFPT
jgi:hypothetical protein